MSVARPRATRRGARVDWVKFDAELARDGSVDPVDKSLYAAIASFVDTNTRESPETLDVDPNAVPDDVPTRKRLAECIGRSVDTVDRVTKRLEARRLLRVHRQPDPDNPKRMLPSEYELLDHELWDERAAARKEARAARRAAADEHPSSSGGSRTGAATPGRMDAATPGRTGAAVKEEREVEEENGERAPSARSAGDARRATTGSSGRASVSGSAASGKAGSSSGKSGRKGAGMTPEQAAAVQRVAAALPAELVELLPYGTLPASTRAAILGELRNRTPEQLAERVARRWHTHGYAAALHDPDGKGLARPVAVVHGLFREPECADRGCEDGVMIDTGAPCRTCEQRRADRRADRRAGRDPDEGRTRRPAADLPTWWECVDCRDPYKSEAPSDRVCGRCRSEAEAAAAELLARWERSDAETTGRELAATAAGTGPAPF